MRVLIIQENSRHESNKEFRECFCMQRSFINLGCSVVVWGLGHENFNDDISFDSFDLIINLENYDTINWTPDLSSVNSYKLLWSIDAHCRGVSVFDRTFDQGRYNLLLHSTRDYAIGKNRVWFPNSYDDSLIFNTENEREFFVGFCGNYANRKIMIDDLEKKYGLKKDIFVIGHDMVRAINSYQIHFNKNISNDINYRSFETIGCETLLLTNYNDQYLKLGFIDMENCVLYSSHHDMLDKVDFLKQNPNEIKKISNKGKELASNHTYNKRVEKLLEFLGDKI